MARNPCSPFDQPISSRVSAVLDRPLHSLGFAYSHLSADKVTGNLTVNDSWCQPFKRMHGGVSAFVAEGVASAGAYVASGFQRVAGIQLSINHLRPAFIGDQIDVEATRILLGKTIQVWEVQLWRTNPTSGEKVLLSTSRVTMLCSLPTTEEIKDFEAATKKFAKL